MAWYSKKALLMITDPETGAVLDQCSGPAGLGNCPRVNAGDVIACAGSRLEPVTNTGIEGWTCMVAPDARECPLAWMPVRSGP